MPLNIKDLTVRARDFGPGERIPDRHAANHGNVVPEIEITGVPEGTVELALIVHDPDAPLPHGFTHWVVYGIEPTGTTATVSPETAGSFRQGPNSLGDKGWSGPQPPAGHGPHHYYLWAYALGIAVSGEPAREAFLAEYGEHVIEQNRLVGTYSA
jgi:Raf kinase inhibitor-like YbhB/YbcL family protein